MVAGNLGVIRLAIEKARISSPLAAPAVCLIAASKTQDAARLAEAIAAGVADFGENRVQEATSKWPDLRATHPHIKLHMIGPLQTNKIREAVAFFDCLHTLDREKLAEALASEMKKQGRRPPCFIQVNTGEEPQKAGVTPAEAPAFIRHCVDTLQLPVTGLMCVPPANQLPAPHFALLHKLAREHGLPHLSMGMSEDFEIAVRLGATHVRVGRALFGERKA